MLTRRAKVYSSSGSVV